MARKMCMLESGNPLDPKQQSLPREWGRGTPVYSVKMLPDWPFPPYLQRKVWKWDLCKTKEPGSRTLYPHPQLLIPQHLFSYLRIPEPT